MPAPVSHCILCAVWWLYSSCLLVSIAMATAAVPKSTFIFQTGEKRSAPSMFALFMGPKTKHKEGKTYFCKAPLKRCRPQWPEWVRWPRKTEEAGDRNHRVRYERKRSFLSLLSQSLKQIYFLTKWSETYKTHRHTESSSSKKWLFDPLSSLH